MKLIIKFGIEWKKTILMRNHLVNHYKIVHLFVHTFLTGIVKFKPDLIFNPILLKSKKSSWNRLKAPFQLNYHHLLKLFDQQYLIIDAKIFQFLKQDNTEVCSLIHIWFMKAFGHYLLLIVFVPHKLL